MTKTVLNYSGTDAETKKWMDKSDEYLNDVTRRKNDSSNTIKADDRMQIMEAIWLWDNAYDALNRQTFLDLMTDDVYFLGNAWGEVKGREAMGKWFDEFIRTFHGKRHNIGNYIIAGNNQEAWAFSYLTVIERVNSTNVIATAMYYDKFVNQGGKWLIKERYQILDPGMNQTADGQALYKTYMENSKL